MKYLAALLATLAIPVFFISGRSSAASQSFTYDPVNNPISYHTFDVSEIGFTPSYVSVDILFSSSPGSLINGFTLGTSQGSTSWQLPVSSDNSVYSVLKLYSSLTLQNASRFPNYSSLVITFYDFNPASSEPCPECPEQPDLPYGEKLDRLYYAVIIVSATMLVLYFMFAIYSMFFKGLK